jgi:hypothetical protein
MLIHPAAAILLPVEMAELSQKKTIKVVALITKRSFN